MSRLSQYWRRTNVNHTQRIANVARQRRHLTKALVREAVDGYLEVLAEVIATGEWIDIPGIGKLQVSKEEGKGYVTSIGSDGQRINRKVQVRLRTKVRLFKDFKIKCRNQLKTTSDV
jgi:hypothetical protein